MPNPVHTNALANESSPYLGGFGGAPKFPHPTNLERLMRDYAARRPGGARAVPRWRTCARDTSATLRSPGSTCFARLAESETAPRD